MAPRLLNKLTDPRRSSSANRDVLPCPSRCPWGRGGARRADHPIMRCPDSDQHGWVAFVRL